MSERWSQLRAGLRVGPRFFSRRGLASSAPAPEGIIDRMEDYRQRDAPLGAIAPSVRAFFLRTRSLDLRAIPQWNPWVLPLAWLWHALARALGQLCLPVVASRISTRTVALVPDASPRRAPRAVIRRYEPSGATMQAIAYAVHEVGDEGFMSAAFALPGCVLEGVLRLERAPLDPDGTCGASLTSEPRAGERGPTGVFLHTVFGRWRLPLSERLSLWDARSPSAPADLRGPDGWDDATLVGAHEQRLAGVLLVRHRYWFRPVSPDESARGERSGTGS